MAYIALYRKYRSQSFGELMGQEHVTRTLQNAIKSGRIAHAYLFTGARGCGKTSTARLLARALNCIAQDGPTPEPCGECRLCASIRDGNCMDVIEMDAASETGIDDVREKIIENVQYAPGEARYKVYIIDEVHDLSAKAFDALLKTLEEPPAHVVFVLATTELHKVPITIRSRCQPYQFKRGALQDLAAAVQRVIAAEGCTAEPEAVQAIARSAEGSWRDALSLLEQVLAYSDRQITAAAVHQAIGTVGAETLARVTETLALNDWNATLSVAAELMDSGKDARQLLTALGGHLRDLMLIAAGAKNAAALELGPERLALLAPQAAQFDPPTLLAMMGELAKAEREIRFTNQHRWLLESTLLRLMPCNLAAQTPAPTLSAAPAARPVPAAPQPLAATPTVIPRPLSSVSAPQQESPYAIENGEESAADEPLPVPATAAKPAARGAAPPGVPPSKPPAPEPEPAPEPASGRFADGVTLEVVQRAWPRVLTLFRKASPSGIGFLEKASVVGLEGRTVILGFREEDSFARDRIQNKPKGREAVEKTLNQALNVEGFKVRCDSLADGGTGKAPPPAVGNGNGGNGSALAAAPEIGTLLDAPIAAAGGPRRIADFDMPAPVPPPVNPGGNGARAAPPEPPASEPAGRPPEVSQSSTPPGNGFLAEALELFGGEVIKSERIE